VTDAFVFLAVTVAVAAVVCGHQGQPWPLTGPWRTVCRFVGPRSTLCALLRPEVPEKAPRLPRPSDRRSTPRWAVPRDEGQEAEKPSQAAWDAHRGSHHASPTQPANGRHRPRTAP
jgi:hypothetical protein